MGLFGTDHCSSPFFQMKCDVFYATETQDKYGKIDKFWSIDRSEDCSFYTLSDKSNEENFSFSQGKFFELKTTLYGRFRSDPRKKSTGTSLPLSQILLRNIRGGTCNEETFFIETNGNPTPTIYEIKACQPFIGPFSTIEYWKIQLERSDSQEMNEL